MQELITTIKYALLGIVQGITEPIPISSSGHLVLFQEFIGIGEEAKDLNFEVLMNFASLIAVLIIYRNDLVRLIKNGVNFAIKKEEEAKGDFKFIVYLVIATIPAGVIGILFEDLIASSFRGIKPIAIALLVTGLSLWLIRNLKGRKADKNLNLKDAIIIGFAQSVALIPGISRSGATIVAAMGLGMKQETALRFSFLLYIPVSLGSIILKINEINFSEYFIPYTIAFLLSLMASYISLKWFMGIMERGNLKYFAYYCFALGLFLLFV